MVQNLFLQVEQILRVEMSSVQKQYYRSACMCCVLSCLWHGCTFLSEMLEDFFTQLSRSVIVEYFFNDRCYISAPRSRFSLALQHETTPVGIMCAIIV